MKEDEEKVVKKNLFVKDRSERIDDRNRTLNVIVAFIKETQKRNSRQSCKKVLSRTLEKCTFLYLKKLRNYQHKKVRFRV